MGKLQFSAKSQNVHTESRFLVGITMPNNSNLITADFKYALERIK